MPTNQRMNTNECHHVYQNNNIYENTQAKYLSSWLCNASLETCNMYIAQHVFLHVWNSGVLMLIYLASFFAYSGLRSFNASFYYAELVFRVSMQYFACQMHLNEIHFKFIYI